MQTIHRRLNFFSKHYYLIFGISWLILGAAYFWQSAANGQVTNFERILSLGYAGLGALYLFSAYRNREKVGESISWDDHSILLKKNNKKAKMYDSEDINEIMITKGHLLLKARNASGDILNLKGYAEDDIRKLEAGLAEFDQFKRS